MVYLNALEKDEQTKTKTSSCKEIVKIRTDTNEIETNSNKTPVKQGVGSVRRLTNL